MAIRLSRFGALYLLIFLIACAGNDARAQSAFDDPTEQVTGGSGGLVPAEEAIDGGAIPIGASSQIVVLFRNESGRPIETRDINLYPSSNVSASISLNQCRAEPLPPAAECAIALSVKGLQPGPWRVEMLMAHTGRKRLVTATLSGTIDGSGEGSDKLISDIESIPSELDFGSLTSSRTLVKSVILRNITSNPIDIESVTVEANPSAGYVSRTDCTKLQAGQACIVTVSWAPVQEGPATGVLVVEHNGPTGVVSIELTGEYSPDEVDAATLFPRAVPGRGLLVASQEEIDFGEDIASKSSITVSLVNLGDAPLVLEGLRLSGKDNGLSVENQGCVEGMMLEPIQACPLTLTWSPVRAGSLLDDVQVLHNGARGILVLPVRGGAESAVSQDSQAIYLGDSPGFQLDIEDLGEDVETEIPEISGANKAKTLDGFVITSFSPTRAIIAGPGGSRVVFGGEEVVIGGVLWEVNMRKSGIEFRSGKSKVLLLFDRSLSSVNRVTGQSGSGVTTSGGSTGSSSSTTTTTGGSDLGFSDL